MSAFVAFAGSRSLPPSAAALVASVVAVFARSGRGVAVGCSVGADALVLQSAVSLGAPVQVFAVGACGGQGFWGGSALSLVRWAFGRRGVSVAWCAGGPLSVRLVSRLARRSLACCWFAARSGPGAGLVAFVTGGLGASPGSWLSVRLAVRLGLPVVVFPVGCSSSCFPVSFRRGGPVGSWVPAARSGVFASGFRFVPGA